METVEHPLETPSIVEPLELNERLRNRRQFLAAFEPLEGFSHWQQFADATSGLHVYAHPDLELSSACNLEEATGLVLLGYAIDVEHSERNNREIAGYLVQEFVNRSLQGLAAAVSGLGGRFVLIAWHGESVFVFHDPCGLRTVYYANTQGKIYLASQPRLFAHYHPLQPLDALHAYLTSDYVATHKLPWLPTGIPLYKGVWQLTPNHYLDVKRGEQTRYWPVKAIDRQSLERASNVSAAMLAQLMDAVHARGKLALALTAGWDSRVMLAGTRGFVGDTQPYSLILEHMTEKHNDIVIPQAICAAHDLHHHAIDCRANASPQFREIFDSNVDLPRDFQAKVAFGQFTQPLQSRLYVKGNCLEIARCSYYIYGIHDPIESPLQLIDMEHGWNTLPFLVEYMDEWFTGAAPVCKDAEIDIVDLFYWEHRMGSWLGRAWLEADIVQESFSPYNCRPLLTTLMGAPVEHRREPDYRLFGRIIDRLWPELLDMPINPTYGLKQVGLYLRSLMLSAGIYKHARRLRKIVAATDLSFYHTT